MTRRGVTVGVIGVVAGFVLAAGCSSKKTSANAGSTTTASISVPATSTTAAPAQTTTSVVATVTTNSIAAPTPMCTTGQLTITVNGIDGGLGHGGYVIRFVNTGNRCILHGYPGVDGVNSAGAVVVSAQRTPNGYLGGLRLGSAETNVELNGGQTASALYEGENGPVTSLGPCPTYVALVVTPPNETHGVHLAQNYTLCYPEIHPVVAGTTGDANAPG